MNPKPLCRLLESIGYSSPAEHVRRRGKFPDWVSVGAVVIVPLGAVNKDKATAGVVHIRERCPHCKTDILVRPTAKYNENRREKIRLHLRQCEKFTGRVCFADRPVKPMARDKHRQGRQLKLQELLRDASG